jgi:hypothetical protein
VNKKILILFCSLFSFIFFNTINAQNNSSYNPAAWMRTAKFGIMVHYLETTQNEQKPWNLGKHTSWDSCVNDFNTDLFAKQMNEVGVGYVIFTTQQGTRYFCMPNRTYEKITGYKRGDATAHRDLIADLYKSLHKYNIRLMLYVTGDGTYKDSASDKIMQNPILKWKQNGNQFIATQAWVNIWSQVLKDMSLRYGTKISGWWVDGAFKFHGYNDALLGKLKSALKAGNPNSIVGFNPSPQRYVSFWTPLDDYTAGEMETFKDIPRTYGLEKGKQYHIVSHLGNNWQRTEIRFNKDTLTNYINTVNGLGGAVTIDVALFRDGSIAPNQYNFLKQLSAGILPRKRQ